jgi:hypothetical protein
MNEPLTWQILSFLRLIPLPTDNFWFASAFQYQIQNLHLFDPTWPRE